jgi:hypothetical protein
VRARSATACPHALREAAATRRAARRGPARDRRRAARALRRGIRLAPRAAPRSRRHARPREASDEGLELEEWARRPRLGRRSRLRAEKERHRGSARVRRRAPRLASPKRDLDATRAARLLVPDDTRAHATPATKRLVTAQIVRAGATGEATDQSRIFEIVWRYYVGYSVLNESNDAVNDAEQYEGTRFLIYSNGGSTHGQRAAHKRPGLGLRLVRDRLDASRGKFRLEITIQ